MINHVTCAWFSKNFGTLSWQENSNVIEKRNQLQLYIMYNLDHREHVNNVQNLYWNHPATPPLALNIFDLISIINKILHIIISWFLNAFWLVLSCTYDLLEDKFMGDVTINNFCFFFLIKQLDSMLLWLCRVINHTNEMMLRTSVTRSPVPSLF